MKLAAIYNVWGDWDILEHSIKRISNLVDGVIIVYSRKSNYGEVENEPLDWDSRFTDDFLMVMLHADPDTNRPSQDSERAKRNLGLDYAKTYKYTHFLMMDADELYDPKEFKTEKEKFKNPDLLGLVCRTKVYFKLPTLTIGYDTTLVPFIQKITPELRFTWNPDYPFAFTGKREIRIDPTRQTNIVNGVEMSEITMHHFSWIRKDVMKKIRNSTAKTNIERSTILTDYCQAKAGYFCEFYKAKIESCENPFNIPDITDELLCL